MVPSCTPGLTFFRHITPCRSVRPAMAWVWGCGDTVQKAGPGVLVLGQIGHAAMGGHPAGLALEARAGVLVEKIYELLASVVKWQKAFQATCSNLERLWQDL